MRRNDLDEEDRVVAVEQRDHVETVEIADVDKALPVKNKYPVVVFVDVVACRQPADRGVDGKTHHVLVSLKVVAALQRIELQAVRSLRYDDIADLKKCCADHLTVRCPDVSRCGECELEVRTGFRVVELDPARIDVDGSDDACVFPGAEGHGSCRRGIGVLRSAVRGLAAGFAHGLRGFRGVFFTRLFAKIYHTRPEQYGNHDYCQDSYAYNDHRFFSFGSHEDLPFDI